MHKPHTNCSITSYVENQDMINPIKFSDGSSIEWVNKETLRYADSSHTALIWVDFEQGFFNNGRIIMASSVKTWESCPQD